MKQTILIFIILTFIGLLTYGFYWVAKTISYNMWYEDQVRETVIEMYNNGELK